MEPDQQIQQSQQLQYTRTFLRARWFKFALFFFLLFLFGTSILFNILTRDDSSKNNSETQQSSQSGGINGEILTVNAKLISTGDFVITPSQVPSNPQTGQIIFNSETNSLQYYDGTQFIDLTGGGVESLGGATGAIVLGNGLTVTDGVLSATGTDFTPGTGLALNGTILNNTGVISITGTANQVNASASNGSITLSLPQSIGLGSTPTFAGVNLGTALSVSNGGTGATSLTANGVLVGNGTSAITAVASGVPGECLVSTAGSPVFQACPGGGGAPTTAPYLLTTNDATLTAERALASGANILFTDGGANSNFTIGVVTNPTFAGLVTANAGLTVGAGQTVNIGGDSIDEFVGTGLTLITGDLQTTLGTSVDLASEITGILPVVNGGTGASTLDNLIALGTHTTGNYVASNTAGDGISVTGVAGEGWSPSIAVDATVCRTSGNCAGVGGTGDILNNGQAGPIVVGTNDATSTTLETNNVARLTIDSAGAATFSGALTATGPTTLNGNLTLQAGDVFTINAEAFTDLTGDGLQFDTGTLEVDATVCRTSGNCAGVGGTGDILQNGNSFTAAMTIGTNDNFSLNLETNATTRLTIEDDGDVAIDTSTLFVDSTNNRVGIGTTTTTDGVLTVTGAPVNGQILNVNGISTATSGTIYGTNNTLTVSPGSASTGVYIGTKSTAHSSSANVTSAWLIGSRGEASYNGGSTLNIGVGLSSEGTFSGATTTVNRYFGVLSGTSFSGGATVSNYNGMAINLPSTASTGNQTGLLITDDIFTQPAGDWAIYTTTTDASFLGGALTVTGATDLDGNVILGDAVTDGLTFTGAIQGANALIFDGATDDTNEITLAVTDPGADFTITLPAATGTVCLTSGNCAGVGGNGDILQNGNSFTAAMTIGTNDNFDLNLETNGTNKVIIQADGDVAFDTNTLFVDAANNAVGIGTMSPTAGFELTIGDVVGNSAINMQHQAGGSSSIIFDNGAGTFQASYDSTTSILGLYGSGAGVELSGAGVNLTSLAGEITVGTSDTTGTLLVLDTKTDAGDPTGVNGGMYYNSNAAAFRIYENGQWRNIGDIYQGGQSIGATLIIGTNDIQDVVLRAGGVAFLQLDRTNDALRIGTSDTSAHQLVVDTKTSAGDPTGINGGMYYNSNAGRFRCFENSAWKDCIDQNSANNILQDGNSFTAAMTIGTNDNFDLNLETNGTTKLTVQADGDVGIGTASPDARLELAGNQTQAAWGLNGIQLQASSAIYTDSSTAGSGTAANAVFNSFGRPTLAATNTSVTTTNAATVYIQNSPLAGTNQTITNAYALWVDNGNVKFDGDLYALGQVGVGTSAPTAKLEVDGGLSAAAWGTGGIQIRVMSNTFTDTSTAASGTATNAVFTSFNRPTLAATNASVTTTHAATLYIANSPLAGTNMTITNAYALWVNNGTTRLDGNTVIGDASTDTLTITAGSSGAGITLGHSSFANCGSLTTVANVLTCGSASGSLFTDAGAQTYLTATADELSVGGNGTSVNAKLSVIGDNDEEQLLIRAHSGQTNANPLVLFQNSAGTEIGRLNVDASDNVALGASALSSGSLSGNRNVAISGSALLNNTSGSDNVGIGYQALRDNITGSHNLAIGDGALTQNSNSTDNIALGNQAMLNSEGGQRNIALGNTALFNNTGSSNFAGGYQALRDNTSGSNSIAIGDGALAQNSAGSGNIALGFTSMFDSEGGSDNIALGNSTLTVSTGSNNVVLGYHAGDSATSADGNVLLGFQAGENITTGDQNVIIGYDLDAGTATGNNQLNIAGLLTSSNYADHLAVDSNTLYVDATNNRVGVLTSSPSSSSVMQIAGTAADATNGAGLLVSTALNSTSNPQHGIFTQPSIAPASASTGVYSGIYSSPASNSGNLSGAIMIGLYSQPFYFGTGTVGTMHGVFVQNTNASTGTITTSTGIIVNNPSNSGTITTNYGLFVATQTAGTTDYGVYIQGADTYALFIDAGDARFDGNIIPGAASTVDIGTTSLEIDDIYVGDNNGLRLGLDQDALLAYDEATDDRVELTGSGASLFIEDRLSLGVQTITITDDGTANDTLTPTASYIRIDIDETNNAGTPDLVISETGVKDGDILYIINYEIGDAEGADDSFTITNSATVVNLPGAGTYTSSPRDVITLIYVSDRWVTVSSSNN